MNQFDLLRDMDPTQKTICSSTFHVIFETCLPHFSLVDLVRLSTSSKVFAKVCKSHLAAGNRLLAHRLLRKTVQAAAQSATPTRRSSRYARNTQNRFNNTNIELQQYVRALEWLLQVAGSERLLSRYPSNPHAAETVSILLQTKPAVHLDISKALVAAGLRITYQQVFEAAHSNPEGLAVWFKAHQRLRIQTGFPPHVTNICCGWGLSLERLPCGLSPNHLADLIYLALSTARSAVHFERISYLIQLPEAADIKTDVLLLLLHAAVAKHCSFTAHKRQPTPMPPQEDLELVDISYGIVVPGTVVSNLCRVPAAKRLTQRQVVSLLQSAADASSAALMQLLCTQLTVAVTCLTADAVTHLLLHVATQHTYNTDKIAALCAPLCALPAMQQLRSSAVLGLLQQTIRLKATGVVVALCSLPGAKKLQQQTVKELKVSACKFWGASCAVAPRGAADVAELQLLAEVCGCL